MSAKHGARGFGLLEVLISGSLVVLAAMAAVAYVARSAQHADWSRDKVFARQKALSILAELRAYVEGGEGEVAADLDGFDDGITQQPNLTIAPDPDDPGAFVAPEHPVSGNIMDSGQWRWFRRISVRAFPGVNTRDLRICTVRMFRMRAGDPLPGESMAEVSSVIRTIGDAYPTTQVYDVYLLALENVPGWWVYMDAIQPFVEATLTDLESRNPGLTFRTHWITKSGFGRDEQYAPYTNEARDSQQNIPWAYAYPGKMPSGSAAERYYPAERIQARVNRDGENAPSFVNAYRATEPFTDTNGNLKRDAGEPYTDTDGNGRWDLGNPVPYALADQHNACMRAPDEQRRFAARVAAGQETDDTPTMRLLLDRMIAEPARYHNAILINLHGELLAMPPVRNTTDAAKDPVAKPGWRAVAHPERLRMVRVAGNDASSTRPRWRVYAYKTAFPSGHERLTTQAEPYLDVNGNGQFDTGESYQDWNGSGARDAEVTITVSIPGGDFSQNVNGTGFVPMMVTCLPGGIDADGNGTGDPYTGFASAKQYPEAFTDANGDNRRQVVEPWLDLNGNGLWDTGEPYQNLDGDGARTAATETLVDQNGNGLWDAARPAEPFTDANGNARWDAAEPYWDRNGNGSRNAATTPVLPWRAWNPAVDGASAAATSAYIAAYGEPFQDLNGNSAWTPAEAFFDCNQNGCWDGGFKRGEMWFEARFDATGNQTLLFLHGTPLETPYLTATTGLDPQWRLYDLDYVPCPTPASAADTNRFARDLATTGSVPKNTARWVIEMTVAGVRRAFETAPGANNGDARDLVLEMDTRIGSDLTSGTMWPTTNMPCNLARSYAWYCDSLEDVPFSERYQFQGDPRHSPYADTDATGASFPHGYNWFFDNMQNGVNATTSWLAFDGARLRDTWKGARGSGHDVGRLMYWLRTAVAKTEAVYTTLTGFSYYYLSLGGDVGYDSANGFANSIPMSGTPFGLSGSVNECTIIDGIGTASISGSLKYVRSNNGTAANGMRSGGVWWSKPWLGELYEDGAYAGQWAAWGNLRAATGSNALQYRLMRRADAPTVQQPRGTTLVNAYARLQEEGCTAFFNIGTSSPHSTFHHQFADGGTGALVEDGPQLAQNYNFPLPTTAGISRPWGLTMSGAGTWGDEFTYTSEYPRFTASMVRKFYNSSASASYTGSGLVRLREPGGARGGYVVVNGIDKTIESGSAFISRYSLLTLIHSYFAAGLPSTPNRVRQLPRVQVRAPTLITQIDDPASINVQWSVEWKRWDGLPYTTSYASNFSESENELVYVPLYSADSGLTWKNMRDGSTAALGVLPWITGTGPDPAKTLTDAVAGGNESFTWATPAADFPQGSYLIRIEAYRAAEALHYSQHMEKIYVNR